MELPIVKNAVLINDNTKNFYLINLDSNFTIYYVVLKKLLCFDVTPD